VLSALSGGKNKGFKMCERTETKVSLIKVCKELSKRVASLEFSPPVALTYNPLEYASAPCHNYLKLYGSTPKQVLLVGMNPGPFGMAQTGVPFGDVKFVSEWMKVQGEVKRPTTEHKKRPILGFDCHIREASGKRLWGWIEKRFKTPEIFFERFFIWNYCPLSFMSESGANITPDKLPKSERSELFRHCDDALIKVIGILKPKHVIGIGNFAFERIAALTTENEDGTPFYEISKIAHPSPASPGTTESWEKKVEEALSSIGLL
jgi:single-strand selective monofunctional uracil DNA glycosylase